MAPVFVAFTFVLLLPVLTQAQASEPRYKDAEAPIEERVQDLLGRMNRQEKIGQLSVLLGWPMYEKGAQDVSVSDAFREAVAQRPMGMLWGVYRADPWTQKTLDTGLDPALAARAGNALQRYMVEETRWGIPLLLAEEAPHGHMAIGSTVFPTAIGQASTWNPSLIQQMGAAIGKEIRLQGGHIGYGPVLNMAREPRWSRVEETYGEDPLLIGQMGAAFVQGLQGDSLNSGENVASTLKHFMAYGVPNGGHNGSGTNVGPRTLHSSFFPPFKAAIDAGAESVMTAYNSIDGIPCTANGYLFNELLREQWGFQGMVVSDLGSISGLAGTHHVARDGAHAAELALKAGVDADLGGNGYDDNLEKALAQGQVTQAQLDTAVSRVLRLKFRMGLFEDPYVRPERAEHTVGGQRSKALARQVARESIILLKNDKDMLPLAKDLERIAVIGPNAHTQYNQLGDYTAPQPTQKVITPLEGIKNQVSKQTEVTYVRGTGIRDTVNTQIEEAVAAARGADVAVLVLGGSSARDFEVEFEDTGAALVTDSEQEMLSDTESGEGFDRATLGLLGRQHTLLRQVYETGTPVVLVFIKGRPLHDTWASETIPAIVDAWYPGEQGGNAIADVLFGTYNPAGRLPITVPRSVGQVPVYYNHLKPSYHDYVEMTADPLYHFGYGLSYSSFSYSNVQVHDGGDTQNPSPEVQFTIANTSDRDGEEVVQVYVHDEASSVVTPMKQLAAFKRIPLAAGEEKSVRLPLAPAALALYDTEMKQRIEAGTFTIMVGASLNDIRLQQQLIIEEDMVLEGRL